MNIASAEREEVLRSAEKLVSRGKIEAAIKLYRRVLDANSADTSILNLVGDLYSRVQRYQEAVDLYTQTAQRFEKDGFYVKAIAVYKKIHRLDPTRLDVYEKLAELYHRQGLLQEARGQYRALADYYSQHQDLDAATRILIRLIEIEPEELSHRTRLAQIYRGLGMNDRVVIEYQAIARFMLEEKRSEEALQVLTHALQIDAGEAAVQASMELLAAAGQDRMLDAFRQAVREVNPALADKRVAADPFAAATPSTLPSKPAPQSVPTGSQGRPENHSYPAAESAPPSPAGSSSPAGSPPPSMAGTLGSGGSVHGSSRGDHPAPRSQQAPRSQPAPQAPRSEHAPKIGRNPVSRSDEAELLAEAQVFVKYGLQQKALDRLKEVLQLSPRNLSAHHQLISLHIGQGNWEAAREVARKMAIYSREGGDHHRWGESRELLVAAGFVLRKDEVIGLPGEAELASGSLVSENSLDAAGLAEEKAPVISQLTFESEPSPIRATPELIESQVLLEINDDSLADLEDLLAARETLQDSAESGSLEDLSPEESESPGPDGDDDYELSLSPIEIEGFVLDEAESERREAERRESSRRVMDLDDSLSEEVDDIFDLAAELIRDLEEDSGDPGPGRSAAPGPDTSVEEIVRDFQNKVAATVPQNDFETHYNLGIAYREMGLLDEAIGEFQTASAVPGHEVQCCSVLGQCLRAKGLPEQALEWIEMGLQAVGADRDQSLALRYEAGECHLEMGNRSAARRAFAQIYGVSSSYRDVVARLAELSGE